MAVIVLPRSALALTLMPRLFLLVTPMMEEWLEQICRPIPSLAKIEVCAFGGNNCAGGGNGGIYGAGGSDTFSILLGGTWGTSVDIAPIGFKYQIARGFL